MERKLKVELQLDVEEMRKGIALMLGRVVTDEKIDKICSETLCLSGEDVGEVYDEMCLAMFFNAYVRLIENETL